MRKFLVATVLTVVAFSFSTASAGLIGVRGLIGNQYPDILFDNSGTITYTASSNQFYLPADDLKIVYSDGTFDWLSGPGVGIGITINLEVDNAGQIVGTGTMEEIVVEGQVTIKGQIYTSGTTLLAGSIYSFGWGEAGSELGMFDFLINNTTGSLIADGIWPNNVLTGISVLAGNLKGWSGSWDADFDMAKVEGDKAPVPEPATMCLLGLGGLLLRKRKTA